MPAFVVLQNDRVTENAQAEFMPVAVRAARFILILDVAVSLLAFGFSYAVVGAFSGEYLLLLLFPVLAMALLAWLIFLWPSRRKAVRWGVVAIEVVLSGGNLITKAINGDLGWTALLAPGVLFPLAVVVLLLTPAAARWFDR
ncbi:hypothetical protein ACWDRB_51705 [Nonomuraea sp. NPDC003707]